MQSAPSGGRRVTRAALEARGYGFETDRLVTRKELACAAREAEKALKLRPALRMVLHELAGCWGEQQMSGRLLVWPSNEYLVDRTGLSERSVRYAISCLVQMQLIRPRDSANGKRFAIRDKTGAVVDAFGFDLTPLYARRDEFIEQMEILEREKEAHKRAFDDLTILRRATQEALRALAESENSATFDDLSRAFDELVLRTPRRSFQGPIDALLEQWAALRDLVEQRVLESGCAGKNDRHIENNKNAPSESCYKAPENGEEAKPEEISLRLVIEATPAMQAYGHRLGKWSEVFAAAREFRPAIGAHESAWSEAVERLGLARAATAVLYVAQLHDDDVTAGAGRIKNPGGYFRALVRMIDDGRVDLAAELVKLRNRHRRS